MARKSYLLILFSFLMFESKALANWTLNLGYHNPRGAQLGVNFLYWGSQWNFELGLGWIDADAKATDDKDEETKDDDKLALAAAGGLNLKYRFTTGGFAPYLMLGIGAATGAEVGDQNDAGASLGGPYAGLGLMMGKPAFYGYLAYTIGSSQDGQVQAGIGFDI